MGNQRNDRDGDERARGFPRQQDAPAPTRRDVGVVDLMSCLRTMLHMEAERSAPEEGAAAGRVSALPTAVVGLDCDAWLAWARAGLQLFASETLPTMRAVKNEAWRATLVVGMARHGGNITQLANTLGTSRRALRERLKAAGLYAEPPKHRCSVPEADPDVDDGESGAGRAEE